jgi:hypothetical protein
VFNLDFIKSLVVIALTGNFCMMQKCLAEYQPQAIQREYFQEYSKSPFSVLSKDYFARFYRDDSVQPSADETLIGTDWEIAYSNDAHSLTVLMANYLNEFLNERMHLSLTLSAKNKSDLNKAQKAIVLLETGGGASGVAESFTINAGPNRVGVTGSDLKGLRDGIVKLVSDIGLKQAPIVSKSERTYKPRIKVRASTVPWMGSYRDLIFRGYNSVMITGSMRDDVFEAVSENIGSLRMLSQSNAIAELKRDQDPGVLARLKTYADEANEHGLGVYIYLNLTPRIFEDDPIFKAHPEIRGALINDGPPFNQYHLCTSHPLVRQYLRESVKGILGKMPYIQGIVIIIGGEEFLHCFMRPYNVPDGHETNCKRCDQRGLATVLSDLCDYLGDAARQVNPDVEILAWPYSAVHYWVGHKEDRSQLRLIEALKPGTSLLTDVVKDDYVKKPGGINKLMWDYSIDMPGPGPRARRQIKACHANKLKTYIHSEPDLAFEISRLPYIACMDRWAQRAEGIASSKADGTFIWAFFRPDFGVTSGEVFQYFWWDPVESNEDVLVSLANRIVGNKAGSALREAWRWTSEAVGYSPVMDDYLSGPMYLGPAHPMCANPAVKLAKCFYGVSVSPRTDVGVFNSQVEAETLLLSYYRKMENALLKAVNVLESSKMLVPRERLFNYEAEAIPIKWFYHTARAAANFYESCILRDKIHAAIESELDFDRSPLKDDYYRWLEMLVNERQNAVDALPLMKQDMRLDYYYGHNGAGISPHGHGVELIQKKIEIIESEINSYLPELRGKLGI